MLIACQIVILLAALPVTYLAYPKKRPTGDINPAEAQRTLMHELIEQSEQLNRTVTLEEVISTIGSGALALTQAEGAAVFTRDPQGQLICAWSLVSPEKQSPDFLKAIAQMLALQPENAAAPILIADVDGETKRAQVRGTARLIKVRAVAAWPLTYAGKTIAFVCSFYHNPTQLPRQRHEIIEAFYRQAAVSLENARLFEAECAQRRLSDALRDISGSLNSTLDLDGVLEAILNSLHQVVQHDAAGIMLIEGDVLTPARWHGIPKNSAKVFSQWRYSLKDLRNRQMMLETIQAAVIPETSNNPHWIKTTGLEWVRSYAGAPICQRGKITGFIDVMSGRAGFFQPEIGPILQSFANQAAVALENARLYQSAQQRMAETSALYRAIQPLFNPTEDIIALAQQITQTVTEEFSSVHCEILLVNEARTHLVVVAQSGALQISRSKLPLDGPGLTVAAAVSGKVIYAPDVSQSKDYFRASPKTSSELVIPMHAGGRVIGVLNLENPELNAFGESERRILVSFAERAALGLENARLFDTVRRNATQMAKLHSVAQRKAQEAEILREATASLSSTLDLQTVLDSIIDQLEQVVPHDSACIFLVNDERHMHAAAVKGVQRPEEVLYQSFPRDDALLVEIGRTLQPVVLTDAQADARFHGWGGTNHVRGWMGVPLIAAGELTGVLTLDRHEIGVFEEEETKLAQAFANQAAAAVQNARLYHATKQRARQLEALHTATTSLVSTLDLQNLLERILAAAGSAVQPAQAAALHLLNDDGRLELRVQQRVDQSQLRSPEWNGADGPWSWTVHACQPVLISEGFPYPPGLDPLHLSDCWRGHSLLLAPLVMEDRCLGVISLISPAPDAFDEQAVHLLISFASTAMAAIHNAQLHSEVRYLAVTDPLTEVYNRRGFFDLAEKLIAQAQQTGQPVSAVMIDIDYFKRINDQYGHDAGDSVLRELSRRCRGVLDGGDLICRYGGEEFAIFLAGHDKTSALATAQRLFHIITDQPMQTLSGPVNVTISVGIATLCENCNTVDRLLRCADQALYVSKEQGRSRVSAWHSSFASIEL